MKESNHEAKASKYDDSQEKALAGIAVLITLVFMVAVYAINPY